MAKTITATVKFFDQKKGYGFFERKNGGDVFVHATKVEASGFHVKSMMSGVVGDITYECNGGKREVVSIQLLGGLKPGKRKLEGRMPARKKNKGKRKIRGVDAEVHNSYVAQVKFFNSDKGYGFLRVLSEEGINDLFFHICDIDEDLHPPQDGVIYDVTTYQKDGRIRAMVCQEHDGEYAEQARKAA